MLNEQGIVNKLVTSVMIALLTWMAYTLQQVTINQAVQSTEIQAIQATLGTAVANSYSRSEALASIAILTQKLTDTTSDISSIETQIEGLRERVRDLENGN